MQIDDKELQEFITLYESEFGDKLAKLEASEVAGNLAELYTLLSEPLPEEQRTTATPGSDPAGPASHS